MTPVLLLTISGSMKKQIAFVLLVLVIILALPIMSVFALGTKTLSFLSGSSSPGTSSVAVPSQSQGLYQGPLVSGDSYAWGNCTYWVFFLREQGNDPIPTSWGNAATWAFYAQIDGYQVDHTPAPGSIMQISDVDGGLGHVAYVTAVGPTTGAWTISEMNVLGLDVVDTKTLPAADASSYNFIHDKAAP
ncbi:MAG TPA: CHAP domain-containing protein [Candidatus Saccharimonadales bacterium]